MVQDRNLEIHVDALPKATDWASRASEEVGDVWSAAAKLAVPVAAGLIYSRFSPIARPIENMAFLAGAAVVGSVGVDLSRAERPGAGEIAGDAALATMGVLLGAKAGYALFGKPVSLALREFNPMARVWRHNLEGYADGLATSGFRVRPIGNNPLQNFLQPCAMGRDSVVWNLAGKPYQSAALARDGETFLDSGAILKISKRPFPELGAQPFGELVLDQGTTAKGAHWRISAKAKVGLADDVIRGEVIPQMERNGWAMRGDDIRSDNFGTYTTKDGRSVPVLLDPFAAMRQTLKA